jgi:ADP-ribosyl-[dinitrogen reductase] hydrolase
MNRRDRYRGALLGLAAGDALGTTLEFRAPGGFTPIDGIVGGGPFGLAPGQWTDDTSMALCLAHSLLDRPRFDPADQMDRYLRWWREGYLSSTGSCFDIGTTVRAALESYAHTGNPYSGRTDPHTAGNGSLMRLAPVALAYARSPREAVARAADSSRTTHGAREAVDACRYFAGLLVGALDGRAGDVILGPRWSPVPGLWTEQPLAPAIEEVALGSFRRRRPPEIRGTGYVVRSLEAALWALSGAETFRDACLRAANLGDDADTTAAITGQLAGALWGVGGDAGVPDSWVAKLALRDEIEELADGLRRRADVGDRAFRVDGSRLLAGAYPGDRDPRLHASRLDALVDLGVTRVVSLMEEGEVSHGGEPFRPYASALDAAGVAVERHPIRDGSTPSVETVAEILDAVDAALAGGDTVYVHCWGGRGRTGTIIGCWLVRHGRVEPDAAVDELRRLRAHCADAHERAPETRDQERRVRAWRRGQ